MEVILATALFGLLVTALVSSLLYGQEASVLSGNQVRATMLAEEGLEAVRNMRDENFQNLRDGTYGLTSSSNQWAFSGNQDVTDKFTRKVTISTMDENRKEVVVTVNWQQNPQRIGSITLESLLTYWMAIKSWSNAELIKTLDLSGMQDGIKIQVSGNYAYMIRNGGTPNFAVIDVNDPENAFIAGSLNLPGTPTNLSISGNYAYVSTTDNTRELQIINISNPASPISAGSYNASDNFDARGVFAVGTTAYLTRAPCTLARCSVEQFTIINVTNPASPSKVGAINSGALSLGISSNTNLTEVYVSGNYAYLASDDNSSELLVINITNPSSPTRIGTYNASGTSNGITVAPGPANRILLGTAGNGLYLIDVSTPNSPTLISTFSVGDQTNDIAYDETSNLAFLATNHSDMEFQVVSYSTPSTPTLAGSINLNALINGVAYDAVKNTAYGVGNTDNQEFAVIKPQ